MVKICSESDMSRNFKGRKIYLLLFVLHCGALWWLEDLTSKHPIYINPSGKQLPSFFFFRVLSSAAGICQGMIAKIRMEKNFPVAFRCWSRVRIRDSQSQTELCVSHEVTALWCKEQGLGSPAPALLSSAHLLLWWYSPSWAFCFSKVHTRFKSQSKAPL